MARMKFVICISCYRSGAASSTVGRVDEQDQGEVIIGWVRRTGREAGPLQGGPLQLVIVDWCPHFAEHARVFQNFVTY